jgi:hypothetical protein
MLRLSDESERAGCELFFRSRVHLPAASGPQLIGGRATIRLGSLLYPINRCRDPNQVRRNALAIG